MKTKRDINRAKCRAIIRELKLRKCDNFKPIGVGAYYAISLQRERRGLGERQK